MSASLISCICITRKRPHLLQNAIDCYKRQSFDRKELIILYEDDDEETTAFLVSAPEATDPQIRVIKVERQPEQHLGCLRNLGIAAAAGDYICQWDDDDWYHPQRLSFQHSLISSGPWAACVLGKVIIYDRSAGKAYLSCYRNWEGTVLCRRDIALGLPYQNQPRGEDTPFIDALLREGLLLNTLQFPHYYVYTYHGANTWDYPHFCSFFPYSTPLSETVSLAIGQMLDGKEADGIMTAFVATSLA